MKRFDGHALQDPACGTWDEFLATCEVRDTIPGVATYYGSENCNYIVLHDGTMFQNYGWHGRALMNRIREEGLEPVREQATALFKRIGELLAK